MKKKKDKRILRGRMAGIALEDLDSKLDMVVEVVKDTERRLSNDINEFRQEFREEISGIKIVLRYHDERIRKVEDSVGHLLKEQPRH